MGTCNAWDPARVVPSAELHALIAVRWALRPLPARHPGEVATRHAFVDGGGEVGFVSAVSAPFCGDCDRARISAEGRLYTCLFASTGIDLRPALLAGGDVLAQAIASAWSRRDDRYSELRQSRRDHAPRRRVEMYLVGG